MVASLTGVAKILTVNLPSIAKGGEKVTLVVTFENVGDQDAWFWVAVDEYEGREGEYTVEFGGGLQLFNKRTETYYIPNRVGQFQQILVMPHKPLWQLRVYIGHYTDPANTVQQVDDWKDITIARSDLCSLEKSWNDGIS